MFLLYMCAMFFEISVIKRIYCWLFFMIVKVGGRGGGEGGGGEVSGTEEHYLTI